MKKLFAIISFTILLSGANLWAQVSDPSSFLSGLNNQANGVKGAWSYLLHSYDNINPSGNGTLDWMDGQINRRNLFNYIQDVYQNGLANGLDSDAALAKAIQNGTEMSRNLIGYEGSSDLSTWIVYQEYLPTAGNPDTWTLLSQSSYRTTSAEAFSQAYMDVLESASLSDLDRETRFMKVLQATAQPGEQSVANALVDVTGSEPSMLTAIKGALSDPGAALSSSAIQEIGSGFLGGLISQAEQWAVFAGIDQDYVAHLNSAYNSPCSGSGVDALVCGINYSLGFNVVQNIPQEVSYTTDSNGNTLPFYGVPEDTTLLPGSLSTDIYAPVYDSGYDFGGGGGSSCFVAGTPVSTPDGDKAIEKIKPGDQVYTFNIQTGETTVGVVEDTFIHKGKIPGLLTLEDGTELQVTEEHPFYIPAKNKYIPLKDLKVGDLVVKGRGKDAKQVAIKSINFKDAKTANVYNIKVSGTHSYYAKDVLVHNKDEYMMFVD